MGEKRTTLVMMLRNEVSETAKKINGELKNTHKTAMGSVLAGVGLGAGVASWGMLSSAVSGAVDAVGDMTRGAIADEASQAKLYTAIEQNAKAWDGNRQAVEDVLKARMKLGFADDEQRDSLALLVSATGDVSEALEIQRTAMDLARLKGISLAEASKAVSMGLQGQGRALKELGINVKELTGKQEILTAVQEKAAGQADAYTSTAAGTFASLDTVVGELGETIGYVLVPALKDAATWMRDDVVPALADGAAAMDHYSWAMKFQQDHAKELAFWQRGLVGLWTDGQQSAAAYAQEIEAQKSSIAETTAWYKQYTAAIAAANPTLGDAKRAADDAADSTNGLGDALDTARKAWDTLNGRIKANNEFENLPDKITVAVHDVKEAQKDLNTALAKGNESAQAAARIRLRDAKAELAELRREYARLRVEMSRAVRVGHLISPTNDKPTPTASGGARSAGQLLLVGETGPELFVPDVNGTVLPSGSFGMGAGRPASGAGGPVVVNLLVKLDSREIAAAVERHGYFEASIAPASSR